MAGVPTISSFDELTEGRPIPVLERNIDALMLVKYAGAADDYSPLHWDAALAIERGFPNVIVHGWLTFALMCEAVTDWIPLEIADITGYTVRYERVTPLGLLTCGGAVERKREENGRRIVDLKLWAKDAAGHVTTSGSITLASA